MPDDLSGSPDRPLLSAETLIAWRGGLKGRVPGNIILTHQASLFRALTPPLRTKAIKGLFPEVRMLAGSGDRIAIAGGIGIGGPATAMAVEELAVAGAERIVMVDVAGGLAEGFVDGDVLLVSAAVAADGTSRHYLPAGVDLVAGAASLLGPIEDALRRSDVERDLRKTAGGRVISTDAPFRETAALLAGFRAREAVAVDMETAAFYASAAALGVDAGAVLVIGDVLDAEDGWRPPMSHDSVRAELVRVAGIVKQVLLA